MELASVLSPELAQLVGGLGAGALAYVARKFIPGVRMIVRLQLDTRRKVRRLEAALDQGSPDGPSRPRTVTPQPDDLERAAERFLASGDGH